MLSAIFMRVSAAIYKRLLKLKFITIQSDTPLIDLRTSDNNPLHVALDTQQNRQDYWLSADNEPTNRSS